MSADIVQFDEVQDENHKLFDDLIKNKPQLVSRNGLSKSLKCGNESFAKYEQVYFQLENEILNGEVKTVLNDFVIIYSENKNTTVKPNLVFHRMKEGDQGIIEADVNGTMLKGKIVGKNSERIVFNNDEKLILLDIDQSKKILQEKHKWDY